MNKHFKPGNTVSFRLAKYASKPLVDWLNNQSNINSSLVYALENYIMLNGTHDIASKNGMMKNTDIRGYILVYMYNLNSKFVHINSIYNHLISRYTQTEDSSTEIINQKSRIMQALMQLVNDGIVTLVDDGFYTLSSK